MGQAPQNKAAPAIKLSLAFPGWRVHDAAANISGECRFATGFNAVSGHAITASTTGPVISELSVRVTDEVKAAVEKAAADDSRSTASYVERLLIAQLKKDGYLPKQ